MRALGLFSFHSKNKHPSGKIKYTASSDVIYEYKDVVVYIATVCESA